MIVVHRDLPGVEHDVESGACLCEPFIIQDDDDRSDEEIMAEIERAQRPQ